MQASDDELGLDFSDLGSDEGEDESDGEARMKVPRGPEAKTEAEAPEKKHSQIVNLSQVANLSPMRGPEQARDHSCVDKNVHICV